jgi:hypothetical protein
MLLIVTGCSNKEVIKHNYTYKGENELWTAEYKVNGIGKFTKKDGITDYKSNSDEVLTITYKKELSEIASVKHLEISYESSAGGGTLTNNYDKNNPLSQKTYTLKSSCVGGAIETKDEIIKVNINLDGKTQTIELKNVK